MGTVTLQDGFGIIKWHIVTDPEYAWAWHCNFACCAMDEGLDHAAANRAAARMMYNLFQIDMKNSPYWKSLFGETEGKESAIIAEI